MESKVRTELTVTPKTVTQQYEYDGVTVLTTDLTIPVITGVPLPVMKRLNQFYGQLLEELTRYAKRTLLPMAIRDYKARLPDAGEMAPYNLTLTYTVTYAFYESGRPEENKLSLYYDVYEYTGGAHGNTVRYADNFSLENGYPLPPLIRGRTERRRAVAEITAIAEARQASGEMSFFPDIPGNVNKYFRAEQANLTGTGIRVFYQLYTVAPYVEHIVSFDLPPR